MSLSKINFLFLVWSIFFCSTLLLAMQEEDNENFENKFRFYTLREDIGNIGNLVSYKMNFSRRNCLDSLNFLSLSKVRKEHTIRVLVAEPISLDDDIGGSFREVFLGRFNFAATWQAPHLGIIHIDKDGREVKSHYLYYASRSEYEKVMKFVEEKIEAKLDENKLDIEVLMPEEEKWFSLVCVN